MEISEIKSKLTLNAVLTHYQLTPDRNHRLKCPWHNDKTPSLQIYRKTNTWTCFSTNCGAGSGDTIDFIMKYEKITKHEALLKATELLTGNTSPSTSTRSEMEANHKANVTSVDLPKKAVLAKYFQSTLKSIAKNKKAQEYLEQRNLIREKLSIGSCSSNMTVKWNKNLKESAEKLGLLKIKHCLIFPMKNREGQIESIYGRSIVNETDSKHFYLSGGFKGLYPSWPHLRKASDGQAAVTKKLILTESIIDAASLHQHQQSLGSDTAVLALYGANGWTEDHKEAITKLQDLKEVILFFDGDEAGRKAIEKYTKLLQELRPGITISQVKTPEGEDPNSLLESHEPEIYKHLIETRIQSKQQNLFFSSEKQLKGSASNGHIPNPTPKICTTNPELILYETANLYTTILGGIKITGLDRMRVTLKITSKEKHHLPLRHSLDLYHSKQVEQLTQAMSETLEMASSSAQKTISDLTGELETYRGQRLEMLKPKKEEKKEMSMAEREEAIKYLKDKKLLRNTLQDIGASGIVGETNNSLIAYLAYTSRKRSKPLHIMCLGASGTGKTYLQEIISALMPDEDKIEITSLSDNAFYYFGREELKHKLILIEDLDGAENVLYPLRELQSKRRITKTVTLKDNKGNLKTVTLLVEGPVCVSGCTTREKIYEDNANRCILLYVDSSPEQDKRIMNYQQRASAGNVNDKSEQAIKEKIKNVQRLLKNIKIVNPYAELIDLPDIVFKPRRTLLLLLSFIETITFYHQWQRPHRINEETGEKYIETTIEDIKSAFSLMKEVLFSKSDELSKASRTFFEKLKKEVKPGSIFYAKSIRKKYRLAPSTLKRYLIELSRTGYLKIKGGSKYTGFEYEVSDYNEYENMTALIDQKLKEILEKIKSKRKGE